MISKKSMTIAIDFDGTIVEDEYPKIGKPMVFAFETLQKLQYDGHRLILWTYRSGRKLQEAVEFCKKNGIEFYAVNESYDKEELEGISRKINADIFVDDRNIGGFIGWGEVYHKITDRPLPTEKKIKNKNKFLSLFNR